MNAQVGLTSPAMIGADICHLNLHKTFAIPHEFGHYFAARFHKVDATLPYFIPFPSLSGFLNFGTMGAVIRTKTPVYTKKAMFDIGIAGPLAGFVA